MHDDDAKAKTFIREYLLMRTHHRPALPGLLCVCVMAAALMIGCNSSSNPSSAQRQIYTQLYYMLQDPTRPIPNALADEFEICIYIDTDLGYPDYDMDTDLKLQQGWISRYNSTIDFIVEETGYLELGKYYRVSGKISGYNTYELDDDSLVWLEITLSRAQAYTPSIDFEKTSPDNTLLIDFETADMKGSASYRITGFSLEGGNVIAKFTMTNNYDKPLAPQLDYLSFYFYDINIDNYADPDEYPTTTTEPGKSRDYSIVLESFGVPASGSEVGVEFFDDEFNLAYNVVLTLE